MKINHIRLMQMSACTVLFVASCKMSSWYKSAEPTKAGAEGGPVTALPFNGNGCPQNDGQWKTYWQKSFLDIKQASYKEPNTVVVAIKLDECGAQLEKSKRASTCLANMKAFTFSERQQKRPGFSMGFSVSDKAYYAAFPDQSLLDLPDELKDKEFLAKLDDDNDSVRQGAHDRIKALNAGRPVAQQMVSFTFFSNHLSTIDDSRSAARFFVYYPGEVFDRFYQFGFREQTVSPVSNSISLVAIQKKDVSSGATLVTPKAYYADLWRIRSDSGIKIGTRLDQTKKLENCYLCHKSALISIVPEKERFDPAIFGGALLEVNKKMASYSNAKIALLDTSAFGPALGHGNIGGRTKEFIAACSGGTITTDDSAKKVSEAMNCNSCHDSKSRGQLDFPITLEMEYTGSLIKRNIMQYKTMPPGAVLTDAEREALVKCTELEYMGTATEAGEFDKWLLNEAHCDFKTKQN